MHRKIVFSLAIIINLGAKIMLAALFIKCKHFLFRYFYLISLTKQGVMKSIHIKSAMYAEYQKTIFFVTGCSSDGTLKKLQEHNKDITDYLTRNGVPGYSLHTTDASAQNTEELTLRCNPTPDTQVVTTSPAAATLAAIVDVDYTQEKEPIVEILVTDIPLQPTPEELHNCIYGLLSAIIRSEKEYSLYTAGNSGNLHYRLPEQDSDEHEFIATDLLFCDALAQQQERQPSTLLIDSNFEIHLPLYPQITIELAPLPKALYILLLLHPEGFALKEIIEYASELRNIYRTVSGRQNISVLNKMLDSITDPTSNPLHKNLSIIRRAFLSKLRSDIAERYIPTHGRNTLHRIPLESKMIQLPTAILQEYRRA